MPWQVRMRYAGTRWLQGTLFLTSLALLVWLWARRGEAFVVVGQVEAIEVNVPASDDGWLMPIDPPLAPFDRVQKELTLVARFDVSDALLEMQRLTAERQRLQSLIAAESERLRLQQRQWDLEHEAHQRDRRQQTQADARNLASAREQVSDLLSDVNDTRQRRRELVIQQSELAAQQATYTQELENLAKQRTRLLDLIDRRLTPAYRLPELDEQIQLTEAKRTQTSSIRSTLDTQVTELIAEQTEVEDRLVQARTRLRNVAPTLADSPTDPVIELALPVIVDVNTSLTPLQRALDVQDAEVRMLAQRIAANEIHAPVSGMISKVHQPPGTFVRSGDPIVSIAAGDVGWIVAYVDQRLGKLLRKHDAVQIRIRGQQLAVAEAEIVDLGTQYQLIPEYLRANPNIPGWGLPIKVSVPGELSLKPGELVDLIVMRSF